MRLFASSHRTTPAAPPASRGDRRGFTLIEVVVASIILGTALLAMAGFSMRYQQIDSRARVFAKAQELASVRLEAVRSTVPYSALDTMATTESSIPGNPGYTRVTRVTRTGGTPADTVDFRTVSVTVSAPGNRLSVSKSSLVAAF